MNENQSEVARLLRQIEMEYDAGRQALNGYASVSHHDFITRKMENMHTIYKQLAEHVGGQEAIRLVANHLNKCEE